MRLADDAVVPEPAGFTVAPTHTLRQHQTPDQRKTLYVRKLTHRYTAHRNLYTSA